MCAGTVTPEAGAEAAREVFELNRSLLDKHGITSDYLIKKLKKELNAKVTRLLIVKSAGKKLWANPEEAGASPAERDDHDNRKQKGGHKGNGKTKKLWEGKTIISQHGSHHNEIHAVDQVDWSTRQKARISAHQLRADFPSERKEISGKNGGPVPVTIIDRFGAEPGSGEGPASAAPHYNKEQGQRGPENGRSSQSEKEEGGRVAAAP